MITYGIPGLARKITIAAVSAMLALCSAASSQAASDGQTLKSMGVVTGDYYGNLLEDKALSRAEILVLISRLRGEYDKASKYMVRNSYGDVWPKDWYFPFVSYAESQNWITGYPDGNFYPDKPLTTQEAYVLFIKALGHTTTWSGAMADADRLGLSKGVSFSAGEDLLRGTERGGAFRIMVNSLAASTPNPQSSDTGSSSVDPVYSSAAVSTDTMAASALSIVKAEFSGEELNVAFKASSPGERIMARAVDSEFNSSYATATSSTGVDSVSIDASFLSKGSVILSVMTLDQNDEVKTSKVVKIVK